MDGEESNTSDRSGDSVSFRLRTALVIRAQSYGIVKSAEILDYQEQRLAHDGLFSQRIFGPVLDIHCECGKYTPEVLAAEDNDPDMYRLRNKFRDGRLFLCEKCRVLVGWNRLRRHRFGHLDLQLPVIHPWLWGRDDRPLETLLDVSTRDLKDLLLERLAVDVPAKWHQKLSLYCPTDPPTDFPVLTEPEIVSKDTHTLTGWAALQRLLEEINLAALAKQLQSELERIRRTVPVYSGLLERRDRLQRRLSLVQQVLQTQQEPAAFLLEAFPILPAGLRRIRPLRGRKIQVDQLTRAYQRLIRLNNSVDPYDLDPDGKLLFHERLSRAISRIFKLLPGGYPYPWSRSVEVSPPWISDEMPLFEETPPRRVLLSRKHAALRKRSIRQRPGKRVDYSATSVVVPDPSLRPDECGLPLEPIAWELYSPLVVRRMMKQEGLSQALAERLVRARGDGALQQLEIVMASWPVVISLRGAKATARVRALQAKPVSDRAIHLHPRLLETANLTAEGTSAVVHLPLSLRALKEASAMQKAAVVSLSPIDGVSAVKLSEAALLGCYVATLSEDDIRRPEANLWDKPATPLAEEGLPPFGTAEEVELSYSQGKIQLREPILFRLTGHPSVLSASGQSECGSKSQRIRTTAGRVLLNRLLRESLSIRTRQLVGPVLIDSYFERTSQDLETLLPYFNLPFQKKIRDQIQDLVLAKGSRRFLQRLFNELERWGQAQLTRTGLSLSSTDMLPSESTAHYCAEAEKRTEKLHRLYDRGIICDMERRNQIWDAWTAAKQGIRNELLSGFAQWPHQHVVSALLCAGLLPDKAISNLSIMIGHTSSGWRALHSEPVRTPLISGLSSLQYFQRLPGERHSLLAQREDKRAARVVLRKLEPLLRELRAVDYNCQPPAEERRKYTPESEGWSISGHLPALLPGRVSVETLPNWMGEEPIVRAGQAISVRQAELLVQENLEAWNVRSPLTCAQIQGLCVTCCGEDAGGLPLSMYYGGIGSRALLNFAVELEQGLVGPFRPISGSQHLESEFLAGTPGRVSYQRLTTARDEQGKLIVLSRNQPLEILDRRGRQTSSLVLPHGAELLVADGDQVDRQYLLARRDCRVTPIHSQTTGTVKLADIYPGETLIENVHQTEYSGAWQIGPWRRGLQPRFLILSATGETLEAHYLPPRTSLMAMEGQHVVPGSLLARIPCEDRSRSFPERWGLAGLNDVLGKPNPRSRGLLAEADGRIEVSTMQPNGECKILLHVRDAHANYTGEVLTYPIPRHRDLIVGSGAIVKPGDNMARGRPAAEDLLRILGRSAALADIMDRLQDVWPKTESRESLPVQYWEMLVRQLFSRVRSNSPGDTEEIPGKLMDRLLLRRRNETLRGCLLVEDGGDSELKPGQVFPKKIVEHQKRLARETGQRPPKARPAWLIGGEPVYLPLGEAAREFRQVLNSRTPSQWKRGLLRAMLESREESPSALIVAAVAGVIPPKD